MSASPRTVIIGIGSSFGDDQLGLIVARELAERLSRFPHCSVLGMRRPIDLCDYVAQAKELHIIDACQGSGPPGTLSCRDWRSSSFDDLHFGGTHDVDVIASLNVTQHLVGLPPSVTIWSIEATDQRGTPHTSLANSLNAPLSAVAAIAVEELIARVVTHVTCNSPEAEEPGRHA